MLGRTDLHLYLHLAPPGPLGFTAGSPSNVSFPWRSGHLFSSLCSICWLTNLQLFQVCQGMRSAGVYTSRLIMRHHLGMPANRISSGIAFSRESKFCPWSSFPHQSFQSRIELAMGVASPRCVLNYSLRAYSKYCAHIIASV